MPFLENLHMRLLVINAVGEPATADLRRRNPGKVLQRPLIGDAPLAGRRVLPQDLLSASVVDRLEYLSSIGNVRVVEMGARSRQVDFNELRRRLGHVEKIVTDVPPTELRGLTTDVVMMDEVNTFPGPPEPASAVELLPETTLHHPAIGESVNETMAKAHAYIESKTEEERLKILVKSEDGRLGWLVNTDYGNMFVEAPPEAFASLEDAARLVHGRRDEILDLQREDAASHEPAADEVLEALGDAAPLPEPETATPEAWVAPEDLATLVRSSKNATLSGALAIFGGTGAGKNKLKLTAEAEAFFASADVDPANKFKALELLRAAQES